MNNSCYVPDMELAETYRWLWRHHACLDFYGDEEEKMWVRVLTPLRRKKGSKKVEMDRACARVANHDTVAEVVVALVASVRLRLGLE